MLPIGYRIWAEDKMIYPVKFSMFVNNNKGTIFTRADRENVKSCLLYTSPSPRDS